MADVGYINPKVRAMYGKSYSELTEEEKRILHEDSVRRAKLIKERQKDFQKNNKRAFDDAEKFNRVLGKMYQEAQKSILADVSEVIGAVKRDGGTWSYAHSSSITRSRGLFEQINKELAKLGVKENDYFKSHLTNIYTDQYYRTLYTLGQYTGLKGSFHTLNTRLVENALNYPWSGAMFSDRLWIDKERLGYNLRTGLTQSMILGEDMGQITRRINANINTSQYNAERIARTETKRVTYVSQVQAWEEQGIKEVKYLAANNGGDSRSCEACIADHEKVFKLGDEPTLPRHPNCRCWYIPVTPDTFGDNELNDLTGSVRGSENYEKWRQAEEERAAEAAKANKPKNDTERAVLEKRYNDTLNKLDSDYKSKNLELTAVMDEYDKAEKQSKGYSSIRRGFVSPEEGGFKSKAEFDAADKALSAQIQDLKKRVDSLQVELKDIVQDRDYLSKAGVEKIDSLEDFRGIRGALRKNSTFDFTQYGDQLIEAIAGMDSKERTLQREFYKNGSTADWRGLNPLDVFKEGAISDVRLIAKKTGIGYNEVKKLKQALTEDDIISKLAGGDMTTGSCSSLAFAYIGNRNGLDVTDYRGGNSQAFFSSDANIKKVLSLPNIKGEILKVKREAADTAKIIQSLELDKEYYLAAGKHAAIVKNTKDGAMYLEMQSGIQNGWMPMDRYGSIALTLQKRFGCRKTVDKSFGMIWERSVELMEVDSFSGNDEFAKLMGYINTATDKQKKGAAGSVK